jgi:hypothetical protein
VRPLTRAKTGQPRLDQRLTERPGLVAASTGGSFPVENSVEELKVAR